mmetsp:Transcript_37633/g.111270  ORF Transcript_37633/g.111270 Transcript_37633/m.111270 type:complete len:218 (+) Transcript_37633:1575-2228(+)
MSLVLAVSPSPLSVVTESACCQRLRAAVPRTVRRCAEMGAAGALNRPRHVPRTAEAFAVTALATRSTRPLTTVPETASAFAATGCATTSTARPPLHVRRIVLASVATARAIPFLARRVRAALRTASVGVARLRPTRRLRRPRRLQGRPRRLRHHHGRQALVHRPRHLRALQALVHRRHHGPQAPHRHPRRRQALPRRRHHHRQGLRQGHRCQTHRCC